MNTNRIKIAMATSVATMFLLAGCAVGGTSTPSNVKPADKPSAAAVQTNPLQKKLGEVVTYKDGLSVSVSQPAPYAPSAEAAGVDGGTPIVFNVLITNNSKKNVQLGGFPQLNSGGAAASTITDLGNNIGLPPVTTLLPGQNITFQDAWSVKDQSDLTYLLTPAVGYDQAIFTSK